MLNNDNILVDLPQIVLASGSPRRAEILASVGWPFTKVVPDIDETARSGESPDVYVIRLAKEKAEAVANDLPSSIVLGADTTVVINDQLLGKPEDAADAKRMIQMLADNWHDVLTGVAVVKRGSTLAGIQRTRVKFAAMTEAEIDYLVDRGDPLDKAGAYAVQAQAALFIEGIDGDYWNVVGLPISLVYRLTCGSR